MKTAPGRVHEVKVERFLTRNISIGSCSCRKWREIVRDSDPDIAEVYLKDHHRDHVRGCLGFPR